MFSKFSKHDFEKWWVLGYADENREVGIKLEDATGQEEDLCEHLDEIHLELLLGSFDNRQLLKEALVDSGLIKSGMVPIGTGTLISKYYYSREVVLITVCHNFIDPKTQQLRPKLSFCCGQHGNNHDFIWRAMIKKVWIPERADIRVENEKYGGNLTPKEIKKDGEPPYKDYLNRNFDIAFAQLEVPRVQQQKYFAWEPKFLKRDYLYGDKVLCWYQHEDEIQMMIFGYPGDLNKDGIMQMYESKGHFGSSTDHLALTYDASTSGGMSGGPVFVRGPDGILRFCAIHQGGQNKVKPYHNQSLFFNATLMKKIEELLSDKATHLTIKGEAEEQKQQVEELKQQVEEVKLSAEVHKPKDQRVDDLYKSKPEANTNGLKKALETLLKLPTMTKQKLIDESNKANCSLNEDTSKLDWVVDLPWTDKYGNKCTYTGTYKLVDGQKKVPHGFGRTIYPNLGSIVEGQFKDGKDYGYSRSCWYSNTYYEEIFNEQGNLVSRKEYTADTHKLIKEKKDGNWYTYF